MIQIMLFFLTWLCFVQKTKEFIRKVDRNDFFLNKTFERLYQELIVFVILKNYAEKITNSQLKLTLSNKTPKSNSLAGKFIIFGLVLKIQIPNEAFYDEDDDNLENKES